MTNNILTIVLVIITTIMVLLFIVLAFVYFNMKAKESKANKNKGVITDNKTQAKPGKVKQYTVDSIFNFMEFDKIEDNMIVQKNGAKYVMVIECQGINYDLMSEEEKVSVEEGFIQFLNTLTGPIQIYTQTRTINLENSLQKYREKVNEIEMAYNRQQIKYEQLSKSGNVPPEVLKREYYELVKQKNLTEYGKDIIYNTEKMSLNKNILNQKYYVALSYYTADLGQNNFDKAELRELAFSELYTKSQAIIRALSISGVVGRVMSSTDLVDLLYVAYNRDDAEIYGIDKALRARYDELYTTAPDYMDKKMKLLDDEIEKKAYEKANNKVIEVQTEKQKKYKEKEENLEDIINDLAELIIEENATDIGREVADKAIEKVEQERKENSKNVQKQEKNTRRVSSRA